MVKMVEMDGVVTLREQMGQEASPVILINKFNVSQGDVEAFLRAWADDAAFFKRQPGFIPTQLHRGIGGSCVFVNYAVWESVAHFRQALAQPEFQEGAVTVRRALIRRETGGDVTSESRRRRADAQPPLNPLAAFYSPRAQGESGRTGRRTFEARGRVSK